MEYPENMLLLLNKKGTDNRPVSFVTSKLIPDGFIDEKEKSHIIVFMPLHHNGRQFGYCVMENGIEYIENGSLYYWLSVLIQLLRLSGRASVSVSLIRSWHIFTCMM